MIGSSLVVATATLSDYNHHYYHQRQQQQRPGRIKGSSVMLGSDAGQSSYKRDAYSGSEEAFLLHTSWMDWPDGDSQQHGRSSTLIGQYQLYHMQMTDL